MVLGPAVAAAVDAAAAALRPLTPIRLPEAASAAVEPAPALTEAVATQIERLSTAAEALAAAFQPPPRGQTIQAALADIKAGIERLLEITETPD
jgi:hypothetical protein